MQLGSTRFDSNVSDASHYNRRQLRSTPRPAFRQLLTACCLVQIIVFIPSNAAAQLLPSRPITFIDGRLAIGGEASAAMSPIDEGFFNYTDYEHNGLQRALFGIVASFKADDHISLLGEVRVANDDSTSPYAWYVRIRPWTARAFDIQAGRIPPVFGTFSRHSYAAENPLIGYPLAYQYLTSLRTDAVPRNADELQRMRGRGWLTQFSVGARAAERGLPVIAGLRWDTGVQVRIGSDPIEAAVAVTTGTLSNPRVDDDNGGRQLSGRVGWKPVIGLQIGVSLARGEYLSKGLLGVLPTDARDATYNQRATGLDFEYSRGYWLVRGEIIHNQWELPALDSPRITDPLGVLSTEIEGRYKILPGLYVAARFDRLGFSELAGSTGPFTWDANVKRVEAGGGYYIARHLVMKAVFQQNWRDGGRVLNERLGSAQLLFWF